LMKRHSSKGAKGMLRAANRKSMRSARRTRRDSRRTGVVAFSAVFSIAAVVMGSVTPIDPSQVTAPSVPTRSDQVGQYSVGQTGAASYSVAFALPPSVGPAPSLGLSYSSAGAARGGIAAGWDIQGTSSIRADMGRTTPDGALQYTAYLNGAAFELVPALGDIVGQTGGQNNTAYRPRVDTGDFTRFEKSPGGWRATTKSGLVYTFGGSFV